MTTIRPRPLPLLVALAAIACGSKEFSWVQPGDVRFDQREELAWRDDDGANWSIVVWSISERTARWNVSPATVARDLVTHGAGGSDRDLNADGESDHLVCSSGTHRAVVWDGASLRPFGKIETVSFVDDQDDDGTPDLWIKFKGGAAMMLGGSGTMRIDSNR